jgi:hypothetical protein
VNEVLAMHENRSDFDSDLPTSDFSELIREKHFLISSSSRAPPSIVSADNYRILSANLLLLISSLSPNPRREQQEQERAEIGPISCKFSIFKRDEEEGAPKATIYLIIHKKFFVETIK